MILLIDDHPMFAKGLTLLLEQNMPGMALHHVESSKAALDWLSRGQIPDIILLDLNLPGLNGFTLLRRFRDEGLPTPVLVISASESMHDARESLELGAMGYLSKTAAVDQFFEAIRQILAGEIFLSGELEASLGKDKASSDESRKTKLTVRQLEVLHLVAQGLANKVIAAKLELSENTVKVHLREAFKALRVTNRTACVREMRRLGFIPPG